MLVYELRHAEIASAGPPAWTRESMSEWYGPTTQCCGHTTLGHCLAGSDAAGYDLSRLKPESSWALIQAEPQLAKSILLASTST